MSERAPDDLRFEERVRRSEERKKMAKKESGWGLSWLGTFGLIGWSIALPTLAATAFGVWLDKRLEDSISWTLTMLFVGVAGGCALAWYWIRREGGLH